MKKIGYRRYSERIRDVHGFQYLLIDFKPKRCDSTVYMNAKIDVSEFVQLMNKLKEEHEGLTYYHGLVTIMAKTLYTRPYLNRFVQDRKLYMHNDVSLASSIKAEFKDGSVECLMVIKVEPEDTLFDVSKKTKEKVDKIRSKKQSGIDGSADFIGKIPKFLRVPIVGGIKFLDRKGWLPNSLIEDNLYYSSAILSNLGTFKTGAIYHNLTNFGTSSSLITFGEIKEENGKWYMELGATIDERIADGFYFCKALKLIEYMFQNPEVMLEPASKHVSIPDVKK